MSDKHEKRIYTCATAHLDTIWNWDFEHTITNCLYNTLVGNFELFEKYKDYKFNFEVSDIHKLDDYELEEELDDYIHDIKSKYSLNPLKYFDKYAITEGYEIDVDIALEGDRDYYEDTETVIVVKNGRSWKVLSDDVYPYNLMF